MAEMKKIVVFDFDGTLTTKDTFIEFAKFAVGKRKTCFCFMLFLPLLILMKLRLVDNSKTKEKIFSFLYKEMEYNSFADKGFEFSNTIVCFENKSTVELMTHHLNSGDVVCVVSASVSEWVKPWCAKKGVQHVVCTIPEVKNGHLTGKFATPNCYGMEKVVRLKQGIEDIEDYSLTVYGDSRGDKELMEIANVAIKI